GVGGDDEFSASFAGDVVARAELVEQPAAFDAQPRLQRAGRVVQPCVNHAAVVRARLDSRARMPFEHTDRAAQLRARERGGESRHARADYGDVDALHDVILATEPLWLFLRLLSSARIWGPWRSERSLPESP